MKAISDSDWNCFAIIPRRRRFRLGSTHIFPSFLIPSTYVRWWFSLDRSFSPSAPHSISHIKSIIWNVKCTSANKVSITPHSSYISFIVIILMMRLRCERLRAGNLEASSRSFVDDVSIRSTQRAPFSWIAPSNDFHFTAPTQAPSEMLGLMNSIQTFWHSFPCNFHFHFRISMNPEWWRWWCCLSWTNSRK